MTQKFATKDSELLVALQNVKELKQKLRSLTLSPLKQEEQSSNAGKAPEMSPI